MRQRIVKSTLVLGLLWLGAGCWHPQIHSVIGHIAQTQLQQKHPETLKQIFEMLAPTSQFFAERQDSLMEAAAMPNEISKQYFDFMDKTRFSGTPIVYWKDRASEVVIPDPPFPFDLAASMNKAQLIVKQALLAGEDVAVKPGLIDSLMLRYLLNYAGNLHHPLDNSSFYSKTLFEGALVEGDSNGKKIPVQDVLNRNISSLHSLFDHAFGVFRLEKARFPYTEKTVVLVKAQAAYQVAKYPESHFEKNVDNLNHLDWAEESLNIASEFAYSQVELFPVLNPEYIITGRRICEERITLAGYRLYRLLVELFGSKLKDKNLLE